MNAEPDKILWALRHYNLAEMLEHPRKFPAGFEAAGSGLIDRLTAENEALKEENAEYMKAQHTLAMALAESNRQNADLRNELCLKCGRFKLAHEDACDGCRFRKE